MGQKVLTAVAAAAALACASLAAAQENPTLPDLQPGASQVIDLWGRNMPAAAPASERRRQREMLIRVGGEHGARGAPDAVYLNVTHPTLEVVRPTGPSNGAALVIAPGGGFRVLSYANEGTRVARWAADHGFTAFILKYRLNPMPNDPEVLTRRPPMAPPGAPSDAPRPPMTMGPFEQDAMADGLQAIRVVRARAAEFGVDPQRVGIIGFSAGGAVASSTATVAEAAERPNFLGVIYSRVVGETPDHPMPAFFAAAADDPLVASTPQDFERWRAAHGEAELHIYSAGGHGFGTVQQGLPVDGWLDAFYAWTVQQGLTGESR